MRVLIVGAGPAGVTLAFLLARRDIQVTLVERETNFARVFRGEALMPLGVDALYQMGLSEVLSQLPTRNVESWDFYIDGRRVFQVHEPQEELGTRAVRILSQSAFLERVVAEAGRYPSFSFVPGVTVRDLLRENARVAGALAEDAEGSVKDLRADFVIGCDGRGSIVRTRAGLDLRLLPESYDVVWFKMPSPERLRDRCSVMMFGSVKRTALCYTSWDNRLQYALLLPKGSYNRSLRSADWAEELGEPAPVWLAEHLRAVRDRFEGPVRLNVIVGCCPNWSAPGMLLLGDAAHPMSPIRAQGINIALRDAVVAANHLVPALQRGTLGALDGAAEAFQEEREPEVIRAQALQLREARGQTNTYLRPVMIAAAKLLAPMLGRFRWAQHTWLRQQHDLRFGSTDVRLRV